MVMIASALADTAYVKPSSFSPDLNLAIKVEVAFNDFYCETRYAVRTDTYAVINPDRTIRPPERVETFATTTVLEHTLTKAGTTWISTGERLGRQGEYVLLNGEYFLINSRDVTPIKIPLGAKILSSQTAIVTQAYVTVGAHNRTATREAIGRFTIQPELHTNASIMSVPFIGRVTFDSAPVANLTVTITSDSQCLTGGTEAHFETDADDVFSEDFK